MWYRFAQWLIRTAWPILGRLEVVGIENIPADGPLILIANHQSYLDPLLVQAVVPRPVHTMSKSTQFSAPVTGRIVKSLKGFPVRRFEIDPQAVRVALRLLDQGQAVGIYIEGERSWDGRLQPPRLGTVRLILKAGAPVVLCGVSGAYDAWPRWDRRLRRATVTLRFSKPLRFPKLDARPDREDHLGPAAHRIMQELADLAGVERGNPM